MTEQNIVNRLAYHLNRPPYSALGIFTELFLFFENLVKMEFPNETTELLDKLEKKEISDLEVLGKFVSLVCKKLPSTIRMSPILTTDNTQINIVHNKLVSILTKHNEKEN